MQTPTYEGSHTGSTGAGATVSAALTGAAASWAAAETGRERIAASAAAAGVAAQWKRSEHMLQAFSPCSQPIPSSSASKSCGSPPPTGKLVNGMSSQLRSGGGGAMQTVV